MSGISSSALLPISLLQSAPKEFFESTQSDGNKFYPFRPNTPLHLGSHGPCDNRVSPQKNMRQSSPIALLGNASEDLNTASSATSDSLKGNSPNTNAPFKRIVGFKTPDLSTEIAFPEKENISNLRVHRQKSAFKIPMHEADKLYEMDFFIKKLQKSKNLTELDNKKKSIIDKLELNKLEKKVGPLVLFYIKSNLKRAYEQVKLEHTIQIQLEHAVQTEPDPLGVFPDWEQDK